MASVLARTLILSTEAAKSCFSEAISDGVSIDAENVLGFGLGKTVESEVELSVPPWFEMSMLVSQCAQGFWVQRNSRRASLASQSDVAGHHACSAEDMTARVGKRPALADEVVDEHVRGAGLDRAIEQRLIGQPSPP